MHRVEFRGGPRAGEVKIVDDAAPLADFLPAEGGRYRLDGFVYGFEVGFEVTGGIESEPDPADVVHVRPAAETPAQTRPRRQRTTRR